MHRQLIPLLLCVWLITTASAAERPNLIAIVTDDQGRWAMGAYGNAEIQTPNMDRIAGEGALFLNAFTVTPVCSPSRASYMSGLWPTQTGITDYLAPIEQDRGLGLSAMIWPAVLKQSGYCTAMIGKWHLGNKSQFHPTKMGFDHFTGFLGGGCPPMNATLEIDGKETPTTGDVSDVLTDDAIAFVKENSQRPFAICLHFRAPHLPYTPVGAVDSDRYKDLDPTIPNLKGLDVPSLKKSTREYYASVTSVDRNLGRLLAVLDELGLAKNTLVSFTSDHGYNEGRHYVKTKGNGNWLAGGVNGPKRPNMWDTSVRIPLAMRWPAVIKPGTKIEAHVSNIDTFRTMLGALQVPLPTDCKALGIDFSPVLRGESLPPRKAIFAQYDLHNAGLAYMRMVRTQRYKYVKHFKANLMDELYDLQTDPEEERNLMGGNQNRVPAQVVQQLQQQLQRWQESIDDPILKSSY